MRRNCFALRPTGFPPVSGKIIIGALNGELTVKRLQHTQSGIVLVAENPAYANIAVSVDQELVIWGVITSVIHPL